MNAHRHATASAAARTSDPLLGVAVLDDYRIVAHLRSEPRGDIYRALPMHSGNPVQVKFLGAPVSRAGTQRATWARNLERAERLRRLDHPNIERVLDGGVVRVDDLEHLFVVTELLEGEALHARAREAVRFPLADALMVAQQVAQGIAAGHRLDIPHGDLRITNILLVSEASNDGADARVVLTDFGLTQLAQSRSNAPPTLRAMLAAPESIAPEQIRGEPATFATDVYALGAVLYRLLTGTAPFRGDTTSHVLRAHLTQAPAPMRERCPNLAVPPVLEQLVQRCMAKRQEDRPQSIDALLAGLQECEAALLAVAQGATPSWVTPRSANTFAPQRPSVRVEAPAQRASVDRASADRASAPTQAKHLDARAPRASAEAPAPVAPTVAIAPPDTAARPEATPVEAVVEAPVRVPVVPAAPSPPALHVEAPPPRAPASSRQVAIGSLAAICTTAVALSAAGVWYRAARHAEAPPAAAATAISFEVRTTAADATLTVRGTRYPAPVALELEPGVDPELVRLEAPGRAPWQTWVRIDRSMRFEVGLEPEPRAPDAQRPVARGPVSPIEQVIEARRGELLRCTRQRGATAGASLPIRFVLDAVGRVRSAHVEVGRPVSAALARCVNDTARAWIFPPSRRGADTEFVYTVALD